MRPVIVFLGPTLPRAEAATLLDAIYLPPARQGDLISAVRRHDPRAVLIVDGVFHQDLAVWHKEILWAISRGVAVLGASSMGALRAAECAAFGMIGVGEVYEAYASGALLDDDEVALAHGDAEQGWVKRGEAMVNLRATLRAAVAAGALPEERASALEAWLKGRPFPDRSVGAGAAWLRDQGEPELARDWLRFGRERLVDVKAADARAALRRLADGLPAAPSPPGFTLAPSGGFEALIEREREVSVEGVRVPLAELHAFAALHLNDLDELVARAMDRALLGVLARLLDLRLSGEELAVATEALWARLGCPDAAARASWLRANDLEEAEIARLATQDALAARLRGWLLEAWFTQGATQGLLDELRRAGRYEPLVAAAAAQRQLAAIAPALGVPPEDGPLDWEAVREEHRAWTGLDLPDPEVLRVTAGLPDTAEVRMAALHARAARRALVAQQARSA